MNTKFLEKIKLSEINDFVKLSQNILKNKVFLGTFQLKQSKSYLIDLINAPGYIPSYKFIKSLPESSLKSNLINKNFRLLAVEITSRHKRSKTKIISNNCEKFKTTYKIFILYETLITNYKAIKCKLLFLI